MKVFESACTFDYSWEEVSKANWQKYCAWNDKSTHVVGVDTLSRTIDPDTGVLRTERLITCRQSIPKWISALLGSSGESQVYEVSTVDLKAKKVTMRSTNLTCSNLLSVHENVVYQPSATSPLSKTDFVQGAEITALCGGWQKVKSNIEDWSVERFKQNATLGREGFESVLEMSRRVFGEQKAVEAGMLKQAA